MPLRILIVKLSALGDVLQTLPAVKLLKKMLPDSEVHWLVEERNAELLLNHPFLAKVILFNKAYFKNPLSFYQFVRFLRREKYDAVIDFQGLLKSGVLTFFARGTYKMGFANHREGSPLFYNVKFPPYDPELHAVKRYLRLVRLSVNFLTERKILDEIEPLSKEELKEILYGVPLPEKRPPLEFKRPYVVLIAGARWKSKLWPFENWKGLLELSKDLRKTYDFYFLGGPSERELKAFAEAMERSYQGVYSLVGKLNLKEVVWVLKRCETLITVDTGTMHLASLLNKPLIALFGPTSYVRTGPWSQRSIVLYEDLPCRPCFKRICKENLCLKNLSQERVYLALKEVLSS